MHEQRDADETKSMRRPNAKINAVVDDSITK